MNKQEARIIILEAALIEAQSTVSFLHGCLTQPSDYKYSYPKNTERHLKEWAALVPTPTIRCFHSMLVEGCQSCEDSHKQRKRLLRAKGVMVDHPSDNDKE